MVGKEDLEEFKYDEGDIDELKRRAYAAASYLSECDGWEQRAMQIADDIRESDEEEDVAEILNNVCSYLVRQSADIDWERLYISLFEEPFSIMESHYIPNKEEIPDLVKKCIRNKVRVRTDLPPGSIA